MRLKCQLFKLLFLAVLCFCSFFAAAQCNLNYEVKIDASESENASRITLTLKGLASSVDLKLYDIRDARFPLIMEKRVQPGNQTTTVEFTTLKKTTYSIMATWGNCFENIGGINGIRIDKPQEK